MVVKRRRDRKYRRYGSMKNAVLLRVWVSRETKERLQALGDDGEMQMGVGAVIEKLASAAEKLIEAAPSK